MKLACLSVLTENVAKWTLEVLARQEEEMLLFCWITHVVGRERSSSPTEERRKSQYFLGNSKQSAEKEYFYFFSILLL